MLTFGIMQFELMTIPSPDSVRAALVGMSGRSGFSDAPRVPAELWFKGFPLVFLADKVLDADPAS